jgi:hypothetical protein
MLSDEPHLRSLLGETNAFRLITLSPWQPDLDGTHFMLMTLEGKLPEKTR